MARDPKDDPYYNPDFSPEVNEVTNDFTYKKFADKQVTGDAVIIRKRNNLGDFDVLLIKRKRGPHQGGFALPGGIYEEGMDTLEDFIGREALEEVGLQESDIVKSFDLEPKLNRFDWDARAGKGVDVYGKVFIVDGDFVPIAADDALSAQFINIDDIVSGKVDLAFGHAEWIFDSYGRGKASDFTVGKGRDDHMKLAEIVEENKKRNQDFILEVNEKRKFDNFNIIDLTLDSEFDISVPDDVGELFKADPEVNQSGAMDALSNALPDNLDETDLSAEDKRMIEKYREDKAEFEKLVTEGQAEITDDDIADLGLEENDLSDGDAMTEKFLNEGDSLDLTDEERAALLDDIEQIDKANDPRRLGGLDPNVEIPDSPKDLGIVDEVSKLQDNINNYLNETILENPSRIPDLAVDPLTLSLSDDGKSINIIELVIDENYRNQGLGREVFNRIKEFANNNNLSITTTPLVGELEDLVKKEGFVKEGNQYILKQNTPTNVVDDILETKSQVYDLNDIENFVNGNQRITPEQAQELQKMTGMFVDKTDEVVNKLPLEKVVKNKISKKLSEMSVRWTTFSGAGELLDIYETAVLLFYGLVAAKPELEKLATNYMIDMYNTMAEPYGAKVNRDEYTPDWQYINEQLEKAEKITPTDIIIKKTGEVIEGAAKTGMVTGFGYVPTTKDKLNKTLTQPKPEEDMVVDPMYDRIKRTFSGKFV